MGHGARGISTVREFEPNEEGGTLVVMAMPMAQSIDTVRRITFDEAVRMSEVGIIREGERVELLDGVLVVMRPEGIDHWRISGALTTLLARRYPDGFVVNGNGTLRLNDAAFLQPDVLVHRPRPDGDWPLPNDVALVCEVSRSSVAYDRGPKAQRYAMWGATVYWIIDLVAGELVVHTDPSAAGYGTVMVFQPGERVRLPETEEVVAVEELMWR